MIAFAALLLMAGSVPVTTDAAASEGASDRVPAEPTVKEKPVCKVQGPLTGSRLGTRRICRTPTEWAEREERDAELGRIPFTRAVPPPPKPGPGG